MISEKLKIPIIQVSQCYRDSSVLSKISGGSRPTKSLIGECIIINHIYNHYQIISIDEKFENTTTLRKVGFERDSLTCEMSVNYDFLSNDKSISINLEEEEEEDFTFTKEVQAQTDREPENFNNTIEVRMDTLKAYITKV